ncbi:HNH endonuclease [Mesorhizobium loti]|uniref:HNH endonuclease n=1 Tax=Rhizobium loti TaxID=381 RepID=A0A8E2W8D0_RHILI|nr:HNH endonuclease [Mesorhizobium loti]PWJ88414.1 HNH endonuclease [Mesorhizobium loti]
MRPLNRYQQGKLDAAFRRSFREDARREQKSFCAYCDEPLTARTATADHRQPRAAFGLDHRNNIVAACDPCNKLKGHMPEQQFRKALEAPVSGRPLAFWLAWSRRRINRRLRLMEKRLGVAA